MLFNEKCSFECCETPFEPPETMERSSVAHVNIILFAHFSSCFQSPGSLNVGDTFELEGLAEQADNQILVNDSYRLNDTMLTIVTCLEDEYEFSGFGVDSASR